MTIFEGILLGIVQGFAEFLPISSSGHLILAETLLKIQPDMFTNVALHFATLLAVVTVFFSDIKALVKNPKSQYNFYLLIATAITIIIVLIMKTSISLMPTGKFLAVFFLITAAMLTILHFLPKGTQNVSHKSTIWCGVFQGLAGIAGVSRSASTMFAQRVVGTKAEDAAKFSFLVSIPIIIASMAYELIFDFSADVQIVPLLFAFVTAYVVGIFALKFVFRVFTKSNYLPFIIYLFSLSICILIF